MRALASEMGVLQTVFYAVLVVGILLGFGLLFIGIGARSLPSLLRAGEHRLLALLIAGSLFLAFVFIVGGSLVLVLEVTGHRT